MTTTVLVTGSHGYIGRHICRSLLPTAGPGTLYTFDVRDSPEQDVRDFRAVQRAFASAHATGTPVNAVIHLAALTSSAESLERPDDYWLTNIVGTANLLSAMRQYGCHRLIFASSCSVYGNSPTPVDERSPTSPVSTYGRTKLAAEELIQAAGVTHGLRYAILRLFNVAGGADPNPSRLLPALCRSARDQSAVTLHARYPGTPDGTAIRDYVHVDDVARAFCLAVAGPALSRCSRIVANIGTGTGTSSLQLVEELLLLTLPACCRPLITLSDRRSGDPACCVSAPTEVAESMLDWHPRRTLADIVADAWQRQQ